MNKESADQLIRCVKECWWRCLLVITIPMVALISIKSKWPFKDSPWTILTVIATFMAAFVALHVAGAERRERERLAQVEAVSYRPKLYEILSKAHLKASYPTALYYCDSAVCDAKLICIGNLIDSIDIYKSRLIEGALVERLVDIKMLLTGLRDKELLPVRSRDVHRRRLLKDLVEQLSDTYNSLAEERYAPTGL